jgi:hypothetical protein
MNSEVWVEEEVEQLFSVLEHGTRHTNGPVLSVVSCPVGCLTVWFQPVLLHASSVDQFTCTITRSRIFRREWKKGEIRANSLEDSRRTLIDDGALTWNTESVEIFQSHMTTVIAPQEKEDLVKIVDESIVGMNTHVNLQNGITSGNEFASFVVTQICFDVVLNLNLVTHMVFFSSSCSFSLSSEDIVDITEWNGFVSED